MIGAELAGDATDGCPNDSPSGVRDEGSDNRGDFGDAVHECSEPLAQRVFVDRDCTWEVLEGSGVQFEGKRIMWRAWAREYQEVGVAGAWEAFDVVADGDGEGGLVAESCEDASCDVH